VVEPLKPAAAAPPRSALRTRLAGIGLLAALLGGCATATQIDAGGDVRAFLIAVRDGDAQTFDQHVDRPALQTNLKARLLAATAGRYGPDSRQMAAALFAGPLVDVAVSALVRPQVFRAAAEFAGYGAETRIPNRLVIGQDLKPIGDGRVCALIRGRCTFVFKHEEDGVWRMIDFEGDLGQLARPRQG
jgi:hypothetical protein